MNLAQALMLYNNPIPSAPTASWWCTVDDTNTIVALYPVLPNSTGEKAYNRAKANCRLNHKWIAFQLTRSIDDPPVVGTTLRGSA